LFYNFWINLIELIIYVLLAKPYVFASVTYSLIWIINYNLTLLWWVASRLYLISMCVYQRWIDLYNSLFESHELIWFGKLAIHVIRWITNAFMNQWNSVSPIQTFSYLNIYLFTFLSPILIEETEKSEKFK
jgi:hypothetical protein